MMKFIHVFAACLSACGVSALAATYDVGPGQTYTRIGAINWSNLAPGDVVNIHGQAAHYNEVFYIASTGTSGAPITVQGVPGPSGEPVIIDGANAVTDSQFSWVSTQYVQGLGLVVPYHASYINIQNLSFTGAKIGNSFKNSSGTSNAWSGCSGLYILGPSDHITVHGCAIYDNDEGFFVNSNNNVSSSITVEYCRVWGNGIANSYLYHNWYSESLGITVQYNYFGPTRLNSAGSQFKSRDVGLVFRYNYLDKGNGSVPDGNGGLISYQGNGARKMDMVDIQASALMNQVSNPAYQTSYVYGNTYINDNLQSADCIHYGGDDGLTSNYRKGTLYFYDNTFECIANQSDFYTMGIFDIETTATVQADNNIFYMIPRTSGGTPSGFCWMYTYNGETGTLKLGINYATRGIANCTNSNSATIIGGFSDSNNKLVNNSANNPGFVNPNTDNLSLAAGSVCIGAAGALNAGVLPTYNITTEYVKHLQSAPRTSLADLGSEQYVSIVPTAPSITVQPQNQSVNSGMTATFSMAATGNPAPTYQWQKNGVNVVGATATSYTTPATTIADNGTQFKCIATNSQGTATTNTVTLTVVVPAAPNITTQPTNQTINVGQTASFSVVANGTSPLSYQWQKNGVNVVGATSATYTTPTALITDNGSVFTVIITNTAGTATSSGAILTVNSGNSGNTTNSAPVITSAAAAAPNPAIVSQLITFSAAASDTDGDALTYAWNFGDGSNASGASATHAYAAAGTFNATVAIDDGHNNVVSSSVAVLVAYAPGGGATAPVPFTVKSFSGTVKYSNGAASCALTGALPGVAAGFTPTNQSFGVNINGAITSFVLNKNGTSSNTSGLAALKFKLLRNRKTKSTSFTGGAVPFTLKLRNGQWGADWGFSSTLTKTNYASTYSVYLVLNGITYGMNIPVICSSKAHVSAKFKKK